MQQKVDTAGQRAIAVPTGVPHALVPILSLTGLLALWVAGAAAKADPTVLPGPGTVWSVAVAEARSGALWLHLSATLARVAAAFTLALVLGAALGLALGARPALDRWLSPWVTVLLNVPALVVIVLCYLWIGLTETAAITAVALNKTAMVTVTIREGVRSLDPRLAEMAAAYRMPPLLRFAHVVWPQVWPYVAAAIRNGLAIIWKIVLVVEFLGRSNGVGFQIHLYFQLFEIAHVLGYAMSFVAVMLAIEYVVVQPLDRRSRRWQRAAS